MEQMIDHIKSWLEEAGEKIKSSQQTLTISQKSNRTDLVTNVDRNIQNFLIEKFIPLIQRRKYWQKKKGVINYRISMEESLSSILLMAP